MDPIEQRVRDSLRQRADDVDAATSAYTDVERHIARHRRRRAAGWTVAGVAAVAAAVAIVPNLLAIGDPAPPEVAETPDDPLIVPEATDEPTHALVGLSDGTITLVDLEDEQRTDLSLRDDAEVVSMSVSPGATPQDFVAAYVAEFEDRAELRTQVRSTATGTQTDAGTGIDVTDLPGATGDATSVAVSPDGGWLAFTVPAAEAGAAPAVYAAPIDAATARIEIDQVVGLQATASGDPSDAIAELLEWSGDVGADGDVSHLWVRGEPAGDGETGQVARLAIERTDDGFAVGRFETRVAPEGAVDVSTGFRADADGELWVLDRDAEDRPRVSLGGREIAVDLDAEELTIDARGDTALLLLDGTALLARFPSGGGAMLDDLLEGETVTTGALFGGATSTGAAPTPERTTPDDVDDTTVAGRGVVTADDTTVTLERADGSTQELVTFPVEGESTVVSLAVRPGSTEDRLVVAIVTRAAGIFDVRWLRVEDGEVDTRIDPAGTDFPAPPIGAGLPVGAGDLPLSVPDTQDGGQLSTAWSPEGDLLVMAYRDEVDGPLRLSTIGWDLNGPRPDANQAASFTLDDHLPLTLRRWVWTDTGGGAARSGELLLVDRSAREGHRIAFERQGDGAPGIPAGAELTPIEGELLDELLDEEVARHVPLDADVR